MAISLIVCLEARCTWEAPDEAEQLLAGPWLALPASQGITREKLDGLKAGLLGMVGTEPDDEGPAGQPDA